MSARPRTKVSGPRRGRVTAAADDGAAFASAVLAATLDPIITVDSAGTIRSASDAVERMFGWTPGELIGENVNLLMPEPHRGAHDRYLSNFQRTGVARIMGKRRQFEAVRKDGTAFPIELCVTKAEVRGGGGKEPLFVGIIRDTSERYRSEQALGLMQALTLDMSQAESVGEALTRTLREIVGATGWDYGEVWLYEQEGHADGARRAITRAACWPNTDPRFNELRKAGKALGGRRTKGGAWRARPGVWLTSGDRPFDHEFVRSRQAAAAGVRAVASIPVACEDRPEAVLVFYVRRPKPEDGRLLDLARAAVAPLGQMIRRKRAEEQLALHHEELEHLVAARTAELEESHRQLRMADRLASIGTLAAGLGHDMNNVLLPARARLNALLADRNGGAGSLTASARRNVEEIRRTVAYLQQLADGLHYLTMNPETDDSGGQATDLRDWWARVGTLITKAVPRPARVLASIPAGLPEVAIAPHRLTQAVLNLVVNAGEAVAGRAGAGRVRVWARKDSEGSGVGGVRLGISDNGCGMSEEVKRHAFEMFYTTKRRGMGTGLGLPLVHKIVTEAGGGGGRVEIESEEQVGTTVVLTLPSSGLGSGRRGKDASPLVASVCAPDGREAAVIRQMLEAGGARVRADGARGRVDIRVLDPSQDSPPKAGGPRTQKGRRGGARIVLLGRPPARSRAVWMAMDPVIVEDRRDMRSLRAALGRAMADA